MTAKHFCVYVKLCFGQYGGGNLEGCLWCAACAVSNIITFHNKQICQVFLHVEEKYYIMWSGQKKHLFQRNVYFVCATLYLCSIQ